MSNPCIGTIHAPSCCGNGRIQGKKAWKHGRWNPISCKDHLHAKVGNQVGTLHIESPYRMRQLQSKRMQILGTKHIFPTSINNPGDHLIKEVNNVQFGAKMTVKIMTKVAIWWALGRKIGKKGCIGGTMVRDVHLNMVGDEEAGPPVHVFHRVATLHILQGHPLQGPSNNVEDIIWILKA